MSSVEYRIAGVDDAAAIADIYAPYVRDTIISFETEAPDAHEIAQRMRTSSVEHYPWLAASSGGRLVGYAYACENRSRACVSVERRRGDLSRCRRRSAVASDAALYQRMFELLRAQGYVNAFAGISLPNAASVGLHEAMGFALIGIYRHVGYKLGAWRDVGWWQLALREPPEHPPEPIEMAGLDEAVVAAILGAENSAAMR